MHKPNPAAPGDTEASALHVGLLTGGGDRHYAFGLGTGLAASNVRVDFVGGDESDSPELYTTPGLTFLNLRRGGGQGSAWRKSLRLLQYYARLIGYAASARPRVFHILWNNRFESFDRTLLMLYYKALGKKITLTAHNVNAGTRDRTDSLLNRLTLRVQYRLADHIFVHTDKMKSELLESFGLPSRAVSVIRYGVNNAIPATGLTPAQARAQLGIGPGEKTILFFGNIAPYKGLHFLIEAFAQLAASRGNYRLIVAGRMKKGCDDYLRSVLRLLDTPALKERTTLRLEFIPDEETEKYFQAADVAVLPYVHIFQSGVMFLAYSFGVPVIVSDVGCLRDDVIEGTTGFVCPPEDATRLAATLNRYFDSDIYKNLTVSRQKIRDYAGRTHSWEAACQTTSGVYAELLGVSESVPVPPSCPDHEVRLRPFDANGAFRRTAGHDAGALRRLATRGAGITLLSGGASLAIQTIGTVVLARLLAPEDFGLVTMATTFSLLLVSFGENGLPEAVVQREEIDHALASNLFWINAAAGLLLTMAFAAAGAALALLWRNPLVRNVAAGISVTIVLTSVSIL
ncbi:MAG: glycosyltransferase, partial [Acidobacteriota bacterium]